MAKVMLYWISGVKGLDKAGHERKSAESQVRGVVMYIVVSQVRGIANLELVLSPSRKYTIVSQDRFVQGFGHS